MHIFSRNSLHQDLSVCLWNSLFKTSEKQNYKKKENVTELLLFALKKWCLVFAVSAKWEPCSVHFASVKMAIPCFPKGFAVLLSSLLRWEMKVKHWIITPFLISKRAYFRINKNNVLSIESFISHFCRTKSMNYRYFFAFLCVRRQMNHSWDLEVCMHSFRQQIAFL